MSKVLVIAAHMDDETLGVGGTIAKHVKDGDAVTICIVCKRAYDHRFDTKMVEEERGDAKRAAKILGARDVRFLDLQDERLDERLLDIIIPLEKCIGQLMPSVVYTHHRGDSNQDHRAVAQATFVACRSFAAGFLERLLAYEVLSSTDIAPPFPEYAFQPNYYSDISPFLDPKIRAMKAYKRELRKFPHPRSLEGIKILAQKRGMEIGFHAAEAFMVIREKWS